LKGYVVSVAEGLSTALSHFYSALANKPWCGDDKTANLVRPKVLAAKKAYIAPNPPAMTHWLVFDLDHENPYIFEDSNLPAPNLIVQNPGNARAHLYYAIEQVCVSPNGLAAPQRYMAAVYRSLAKALNADPDYTGRIAKNPLCVHWRVTELHAHRYSLGELSEYVVPISKPLFPAEPVELPESRNCALFEQLRRWAYRHVGRFRQSGREEKWYAAVLGHALALAPIEVDFGYNEIRNTAKSVAKWTWAHYHPSQGCKRVMNLQDKALSLLEKQRLAAQRTHSHRSQRTRDQISQTIRVLASEGAVVSISAVAKRMGMSLQNISTRYRDLFETPSPALSNRPDDNAKAVAFGVHQVTAGLTAVYCIETEWERVGDLQLLKPVFEGIDSS
jgi:hypothetical protein